jgi:hypothetical protein
LSFWDCEVSVGAFYDRTFFPEINEERAVIERVNEWIGTERAHIPLLSKGINILDAVVAF